MKLFLSLLRLVKTSRHQGRATPGRRARIITPLSFAFALSLSAAALAQTPTDGIWINSTSNGTWGTSSNWSGGTVAGGIGAVADFRLDITANRTVNLGANITVGTLRLEDAFTASSNWIVANGAGGPWTLTLATTTGTPTINVINQTATISATLGGTQGLAKTGAGSLVLNGTNTFTGGISLGEGTLSLGPNALNGNLVTFTGDATLGWTGTTLDFSPFIKIEDGVTATFGTGAANITFATALQTGVAGTGGLLKNGGGTLTLTAANTYTGLTRVRQGRIVLAGGDNRLAVTGTIALGQNAQAGILQLGDTTGAVNQTTTSLVVNGSGTTNAVVGGNAAVSTLTVNNAAAVTYAGFLGGAAANDNNLAIVKTGAGALTLSNAGNTFTGGVQLNQGTLSFAAGALGSSGPITFIGSSTLQWAVGNTSDVSPRVIITDGVAAGFDPNGNTVTLATPLQTGPLGTGGVTKVGSGVLIITAVNTYTGNTRINNGRMVLAGGDNRLSSATTLQFGNGANSGVLQLGDASAPSSQIVAGLAATGNVNSQANAIVGGNAAVSTLTINNAASVVWAQGLGGGGANENNLALVKTGEGMLTLSSPTSTFTGDVTIAGGSISVTTSNALGAGGKTISILANATTPSLRLNNAAGIALPAGFSLITNNDDATNAAVVNVAGDNVIGGGISLAAGAGTLNTRLLVNDGSLNVNGSISPQAGAAANLLLILDGAGSGRLNGLISDTGPRTLGVRKEGAGTWSLAGGGSYTGPTTILAGRLNLTTAQTGGGAVSLADGATLGLTLAAAGQSLNTSALTLGGTTGAVLDLGFGSFSNPTVSAITATTLASAGSTVVNVSGTGLSIGQFGLIDYTGTIGGAGFGGLTLGSLPARVTGSLVNNVAESRVDLNITAFDVPKWTGAVSADWDINSGADPTTGSGTLNWKEATSGTSTRYLQFLGVVDSVQFDDSATGTTNVNLTTGLSPNSITVANSTKSYVFGGAGFLSGATTLLKQGSGSLTLANSGLNDFTGTTTIDAGALILGDGITYGAGALGSGAVVNLGSLVFNRPDDFFFANVISGSGSVVQQGGGVVLLQGNNAAYAGVITVGSGTLLVGNANALGSVAGHTEVQSTGALDVTGFTALAEPVTLSGGRVKATTGTNSRMDGPITLNAGGVAESAAGTTLTLAGQIGGNGGLAKEGAGTVIVTQAGAYAGGTVVRGGILQFGVPNSSSTTAAPGAGPIDFAAPSGESATLVILRADGGLDLGQSITSSGDGTNAVIIGAGGAASTSGSVTFSGVNTFTGNVSVVGGSLRITNSSALGIGPKVITVGNASRPGLLLDGSAGALALSADLSFGISSDGGGTAVGSAAGAIVNTAGDNVINGVISIINGGGGNGKIHVQSGTLTLNGQINADGATGNRTIILGGPSNGTANGVISDYNSATTSIVSVTKADSGTWTLTGENTFTGALNIQHGALKVATILDPSLAQPLSTGTAALSLGAATAATLEYTGSVNATLGRGVTVGGLGGGVIRNSGGAVLTLGGTLTRAGGRPLTLTGGSFVVTGQITSTNAAVTNIDAATVIFVNTTNNFLGSTNVYGGGLLRNGASGVLTDTSTLVLGEAVNNTGGTYDLNGHGETIGGLGGAGTGSKVVTNSGASGTATLTIGGAGSYDGVIQDGATAQVALTKGGTGVLVLSGDLTYTGKTTISGGTLALSGANAHIRSSNWVQVDTGATLDVSGVTGTYTQNGGTGASAISGAGTVNGSLTLDGKVVLSAGASSDAQNIATAGDGLGTLTFNNDLTLLGGASVLEPRVLLQLGGATGNTPDPAVAANVLAFASSASASVDSINVAGALTLHSGSVIHVALSNYSPVSGDVFNLLDWGSINLNGFDPAVDLHLPTLSDPLLSWNIDQFASAGLLYITASVPEPSRALLSLAGVAALLLRRRRAHSVAMNF